MAEGLRILVANEPRMHREAHAGVLREQFPAAEVVIVDPAELDGSLAELAPHLVICSELSDAVRGVFAWMLLYPDLADVVVTSIAGRQSVEQHVSIEHLLEAVRETERQAGLAEGTLRAVAEPVSSYDVAELG
jgi:hypothetical protein